MRSSRYDDQAEDGPRSSGKFELFYFEQIGSRTYLRFTRLTLFLIVGLTVLSILLLFVLLLFYRHGRPEDVDVNVVAPTATPQDYNKPVLQRAAPGPTPSKVTKHPRIGVPASPSPTPSPTPAKTPP